MKDYYAILELPVTATPSEIKKAYRKLVMQYHPDKQHTHPYALARFNEIKEAYETLMNPVRKEQYLQERWLKKASGSFAGEDLFTPPNFLKQVLEFNRSVSQMDVHRMNHKALTGKILNLLTKEAIEKLNEFNEPEINRLIIRYLADAAKPLPFTETKKVTAHLLTLAKTDEASTRFLQQLLQKKQREHHYAKWKSPAILLLILFICLLIYLSAPRS